jgi:hypothetical protein
MMEKIISISILLILFFLSPANSAEQKEYSSPDGKYYAYIIPLPKAPCGSGESEVVIKSKDNGQILCSKNYGSEDGEHGYGVEKAAWTTDSMFFVYSMSSSGGHQAWHFRTDFITISDFKIHSLDDYAGSITNPNFILVAPDIIKTSGQDKMTLDEADFEVKLSEIAKANNK